MSGVIDRLAHCSLCPRDLALLAILETLPEHMARRAFLARTPDPAPCEWDQFNNNLPSVRHLTAQHVDKDWWPGAFNAAEDERRIRFAAFFGPPSHSFQKMWGEMLMWTVSIAEFDLVTGLAEWRGKQIQPEDQP